MASWPDIWHADVSWSPSELIRLWSQFVDFLKFWCCFDLVKQVKFVDFLKFWCCFDLVKQVKFGVSGHFGYAHWIAISPFTETGHIWGFWALAG